MINAQGFAVLVRNDATKIEDLRTRLLDLSSQANGIQARADAEHRSLNEEERKEVTDILNAFDALESEIAQREQLESATNRALASRGENPPQNRAEQPPQNAPQNPARADSKKSVHVEPLLKDAGKFGFNSLGEFAKCVQRAQQNPAATDARLVRMAASTYGNEGAGVDGGFAVPPDFRSAILEKVMAQDSLLARTDQQTTSSNGFSFPKDETTAWQSSGGVQAFWENEAGAISQSKPALQSETVKLVKLSALVPVTDELLEDVPSLAGYLRSKVPEKMDYKISDAILHGTGAGQPLGILNSACTVTVAKESGQAASTVLFGNIVKIWSRTYAPSRRTGVWVINQDVEQQLMTMAFPGTGTAVPVYLPPGGLSAAPYGSLMGRPVVVHEAAKDLGTKGDIGFYDFSRYLTALKQGGVRQDISIHLFFDQSITAFRFVLRIGGQPWWSSAITPANGSNTRSCFVTLEDR
jgi:HK97 family phage major capsid protein